MWYYIALTLASIASYLVYLAKLIQRNHMPLSNNVDLSNVPSSVIIRTKHKLEDTLVLATTVAPMLTSKEFLLNKGIYNPRLSSIVGTLALFLAHSNGIRLGRVNLGGRKFDEYPRVLLEIVLRTLESEMKKHQNVSQRERK